MKVCTLLSASTLYAAATAWQVTFGTRSGINWVVDGTQDSNCVTIGWPSGRAQEDVDFINFNAATARYPDPTKLTVYPGRTCGAGAVSFGPGIHQPGLGFLVGSYSVR